MNKHAHAPRRAAVATAIAAVLAVAPSAWAAQTYVVNTCSDPEDTPPCSPAFNGTLRMAYQCAQDGDTVDLSTLRCSTISLSSELSNDTAATLTLKGPGRDKLVLDGGGAHRVLLHLGDARRLIVRELSIEHGAVQSDDAGDDGGGCIRASGVVALDTARVSDCRVAATGGASARGGGIFAGAGVDLYDSIVSGNSASSESQDALGGGVYARDGVFLAGSTVSDNLTHVDDRSGGASIGGGLFSRGQDMAIHWVGYSTLSGNSAAVGAAAHLGGALSFIVDSTIAGNRVIENGSLHSGASALDVSAIDAHYVTMAANIFASDTGFDLNVSAGGAASLFSTILANGVGGDPVTISGEHNLVRHGDPRIALPADTLVADPMLGNLASNGGSTLTMAPLRGSPVIGAGGPETNIPFDQRRAVRTTNGGSDIGAVESETLFRDDFESGAPPAAAESGARGPRR